MRERQQLEDAIKAYSELESGLNDNLDLISLGEEEGDQEIVADAEKALKELVRVAQKREVEALLSGEADANDTFIEVHAGAGGTESQDWAQMLARSINRRRSRGRRSFFLMQTR
jgi:peptide chain release factor 2